MSEQGQQGKTEQKKNIQLTKHIQKTDVIFLPAIQVVSINHQEQYWRITKHNHILHQFVAGEDSDSDSYNFLKIQIIFRRFRINLTNMLSSIHLQSSKNGDNLKELDNYQYFKSLFHLIW